MMNHRVIQWVCPHPRQWEIWLQVAGIVNHIVGHAPADESACVVLLVPLVRAQFPVLSLCSYELEVGGIRLRSTFRAEVVGRRRIGQCLLCDVLRPFLGEFLVVLVASRGLVRSPAVRALVCRHCGGSGE